MQVNTMVSGAQYSLATLQWSIGKPGQGTKPSVLGRLRRRRCYLSCSTMDLPQHLQQMFAQYLVQ